MRHSRTAESLFLAAALLAGSACKSTDGDSALRDAEDPITRPEGCAPLSNPEWMRTFEQLVDQGRLRLRVGVVEPEGQPKADLLYLHGFADRIDNHRPLFEAWAAAGIRVVAFDYPSHGETCAAPGLVKAIEHYDFSDLAALAAHVESATRQDATRPLFLAGWSTGGLLAERILQSTSIPKPGRPVAGAVLIAPGIDVRTLVGEHGKVTVATLTSDPAPPHAGPPSPESPLHVPAFAAKLVTNATLARHAAHPPQVPTLIVLADEDDAYVDTAGVRHWIGKQMQKPGVEIEAVQCQGAKHEVDNETPAIAAAVRRITTTFLSRRLAPQPSASTPLGEAPCASL